MLGDLRPGPASSMRGRHRFPDTQFWSADGLAFFGADDGQHGDEPWVSDGTPQGTVLVGDLEPGGDSDPAYFTPAEHGVVFMTDTRLALNTTPLTGAIWATTATGSGRNAGTTTLVAKGSDVVSIDAAPLGSVALLTTSDFAYNPQLWRSDGTVAGTVPIKQHLTLPGDLSPIGSIALFADGQNPLWRTDGTAAGTRKLHEWRANAYGSTFLMDLTVAGPQLFFRVDQATRFGSELWVSDGTRKGTRLVKDVAPGRASSRPRSLTADGNRLIFVAKDASHGRQIWRTDGSRQGTRRLTDLPDGSIGQLTPCGGSVYFTRADSRGTELWARSAHPGKVGRVADLARGPSSSKPRELTCVNNTLAFSADDGTHGRELWTLSSAQSRPVLHDLAPTGSSNPSTLAQVGSNVFFFADDGTHGHEPWVMNVGG
jgi:ELWxxDGT repeat protein